MTLTDAELLTLLESATITRAVCERELGWNDLSRFNDAQLRAALANRLHLKRLPRHGEAA